MWWNLAKIILTPFPQPQIAAKQSLDGLEKPKNIHFHFFDKFPHDHVNSVSFYHTLSRYTHNQIMEIQAVQSTKEIQLQPMQLLNRWGRQPEKAQAGS